MYSEMTALLAAINSDVAEIDAVEQSSYMPVISSDVTLVGIPFGLVVRYAPDRLTLSAPVKTGTAKLACWVKHNRSQTAANQELMADLGSSILDAIIEHDGEGYQLQTPYLVEATVGDSIVEVSNIPYLMIDINVELRHL